MLAFIWQMTQGQQMTQAATLLSANDPHFQRTASRMWQGRLYFSSAGRDFVAASFFEGKTDEFETNQPQRALKERRRVGRWVDVDVGSGSAGARPNTRPFDGHGRQPKRLSDDHGQQGVDRVRPALSLRDLGAHSAPDGRQAFTRRVRDGVPRGLAAAGFGWR